MNGWLNFQQLKEAVPIAAVLEHYEWKCLRRRGDRVQGRCPIHRGQGEDAFHADLRNNGFHCFSCHAHGSVLDLVALMERYWEKVNRPLHVRLSRLVLSELSNFPELARWYYQTIILRGRRVIESVLTRGIESGEFRSVTVPFVARALQTLCVQLAQFRHYFQQYDPTPIPPEELSRGMTDLYLHGLLRVPTVEK